MRPNLSILWVIGVAGTTLFGNDVPKVSLSVEYCIEVNQMSPHHSAIGFDLLQVHCSNIIETLSKFPWGSDHNEWVVVNDLFPFTVLREPPISSIETYLKLLQYVYGILNNSTCVSVDCVVGAIDGLVWNITKPPIIYEAAPSNEITHYGIDQILRAKHTSCTGLAVFLATCLRMAGVPTRITGVPHWKLPRYACPHKDMSPECGNHNWVEVFVPKFGWSFVDPRRIDYLVLPLNTSHFYPEKTTFSSVPFQGNNSIYAVSYLNPMDILKHGYPAGQGAEIADHFPMVWDWENHDLYAWDVSAVYASNSTEGHTKTAKTR